MALTSVSRDGARTDISAMFQWLYDAYGIEADHVVDRQIHSLGVNGEYVTVEVTYDEKDSPLARVRDAIERMGVTLTEMRDSLMEIQDKI